MLSLSVPIYLLITLVILFIILLINHIQSEEDFEWSIGPTIVAGIIIFCLDSKRIWHFILSHYQMLIIAVIIYFITGFLWSLFKWFRFLIKDRNKQIKTIDEYNNKFSIKKEYVLDIPKISNNKALISNWITFFPISMIAEILKLIFKDIASYFIKAYNKLYTRIIHYVYKDFIK